MLYRITSPYFCCGVVTNDNNTVTITAPIVKYMLGWKIDKVLAYAYRKDWRVEQC